MLKREAIYIWYYFSVQFEQIFSYWVIGMAIGSFVSVFCKDKIHNMFASMQGKKLSLFGIIPACLLGIASPLCMYGTIPIAASFSEKGMRDDWLASFMMASILLNPQLIIYSSALGETALIIRILSCFFCGICAGLSVNLYSRFTGRKFFWSRRKFCVGKYAGQKQKAFASGDQCGEGSQDSDRGSGRESGERNQFPGGAGGTGRA